MDRADARDRLRGLAAWLDASPAEVVGLAVLLLGAVAVVGTLWWTGRPVPVTMPGPVPGDGQPTATDGGPAAPTGAHRVTVHVAGAVARPGLVSLPVGARVADAVDGAGGLLLDADASSLNLARTVADGERLDVARVGDLGADGGLGSSREAADAGARRSDGTLDLNRASAAELQELPGIGPVLAERIVAWRDANGPFTEVGQLREVSGIGERTFQSLSGQVGV